MLLISIFASVSIGSVSVALPTTTKILIHHIPFINSTPTWEASEELIVMNLRLPRVFLAILIGAMLSVSGVAFQGVLRNPLADPYILGVSSGAALGAAIAILFIPNLMLFGRFTLPIFAFLGSVLALILVLLISGKQRHRGSDSFILAGVIVQSFMGAVLSFLITISDKKLQSIVFWMMGSLANHDWQDVWVLIPYFMIGTLFLLIQQRDLNILSLGENAAIHLGMDVQKKKVLILAFASLLAASAISIVGIIGFIGLIIPHLIRIVFGSNHKILLPVSVIAGGIFLLWTDTLARTIIPSREIPIGVLTAFLGAPFFAYLFYKSRNGRS
ncbi:iron complex transport system permease protein [Tepidibacillus fermentans]|uniref:Iron complex transport system permease protein n=1 Tax=Tepidibacillus fermentans TaxID=1281767 RepID=A0A4R3KJT6_9BACI|nr:iron complex transport system permease protein [Tepidibacillus fermentans]